MTAKKTEKNTKVMVHTISREITDQLVRGVIEGTYKPGEKLPTEREMAQNYGVTRNVVREALKRLEALGMVKIRQGSGIFIQDLQLTGAADLLDIMLFKGNGAVDQEFLLDILMFRDNITCTVIRLAATRRTQEDLDLLDSIIAQRRAALGDPQRGTEINLKLFAALSQATHSRIYRLIHNSMSQYFLKLSEHFRWAFFNSERDQVMLERIQEAIQAGNPDLAELLVIHELKATTEAMLGGPAKKDL